MFTIMTMRTMTIEGGEYAYGYLKSEKTIIITITNTTVTEPIKKFSRFVSIPASQEICSCAA